MRTFEIINKRKTPDSRQIPRNFDRDAILVRPDQYQNQYQYQRKTQENSRQPSPSLGFLCNQRNEFIEEGILQSRNDMLLAMNAQPNNDYDMFER